MESSLREKIAGEVTLSQSPGRTLRKWREELRISQKDLAAHMAVSPSMVSDYESGRRKSPGTKTVRKIVDAMLDLDRQSGRGIAKRFSDSLHDSIPSMAEFPEGMEIPAFLRVVEGKVLSRDGSPRRRVHGYTVIDSIKAIATLDASDYLKIYGWSTERALVFTGVKYGRSPMVAIRTHPLKPALVVYVQPESVDELAVKLAEIEGVPLARTELSPAEVVQRLEALVASNPRR